MIAKKIRSYLTFTRQCLVLLAGERLLFSSFIFLSVIGALTEGMTISLLIPLLDAQGQGRLSDIPVLGSVSHLFAGFTPNGRIEAVAGAMAGLVILRSLLQYSVDVLAALMPVRLERRLSQRSYKALLGVQISYIHTHDYGALLNGVYGWSQRVAGILSVVAAVLWNLFIVAIYIAMMVAVSWKLTAFVVAFLLVISQVMKALFTGPLQRAGAQLSEAYARVNQLIMESIGGIKMIRLATAEPEMIRTYEHAFGELSASRRRTAKFQAMSAPLLSVTAGLLVCLLLFTNAALREGEPTTWIGAILLFLFLMFRLMGPVTTLNSTRNRIVSEMNAFEMLHAFYAETDAQQEPRGGIPAEPLKQGITFENVSFAYDQADQEALRGISTSLDRGKMIAVVGPSGAGKTTLIALVARLYDPQRGRLLIDGIDLKNLDVRTWRKRIAVVTQDVFIFNDTVAKNIAFGQGAVSLDRIRAAARLAAADTFIDELPQGYETVLGDRGVRLSGGQQQRISLARAILADPDLLILDEATSHLDTFTERAIQTAVEQMSNERTVLVIAHRLSTIRRADKVIVMDDGRIVEEGRHDELLAAHGRFWKMVEHQRLDLVDESVEPGAKILASQARA